MNDYIVRRIRHLVRKVAKQERHIGSLYRQCAGAARKAVESDRALRRRIGA